MKAGLSWMARLPLAALVFFIGTATARPLLVPPQNLSVPQLPGVPVDDGLAPLYFGVAIDGGTLLVRTLRATNTSGERVSEVHIFERSAQGSWEYAGVLTQQDDIDVAIGGTVATTRSRAGQPIQVFERGAAGWAQSGTIAVPYAAVVRIDDGSIYLQPINVLDPLGCQAAYREYRKVNGVWTQVATIGGERCDITYLDVNDGRAIIVRRPSDGSITSTPAETYTRTTSGWVSSGRIWPPGSNGPLPLQSFGYGGTVRGDTVYIDHRHLYRNVGGAWASAGRLHEPEADVGVTSQLGKLRGNNLILHGPERDYERPIEDFENEYAWNVLRVYRQTASGGFSYFARLNADYHVLGWSASDDGRHVAAFGYQVNDVSWGEPYRLYVFEIPETASFPGTRQDTFSTGDFSRWTVTAGEFDIATSSGTYVFRQSSLTGEAGAHLTDQDWTDQSIEADLRPLEFAGPGRWFGLVTRRSDAQNYYYVTFRSPNVISIRRMSNGVYTELAATSFSEGTQFRNFEPGRNYRMRFESVGDQHAVFIDGLQVLRVKDKTLTQGHPGIAGYRTRFDVDNVVVSSGTRILLRLDDPDSGWFADWRTATGTWEQENQPYDAYLRQTDPEADARWFSTVPAGYQVVSARVRPQAQGTGHDPWFGLAARVVDESNYYYVTLRRSNQISLRRLVNGQIQVLAAMPQPLTLGAVYDLRLEIVGTHIRAYVNGELKIEVTDSTLGTVGPGRNGLLLYKTAADLLQYVAYQP